MVNDSFAKKLRDLLDMREWSSRYLAMRTDHALSPAYISLLATGRRDKPEFGKVVALAKAFGVSLDYFGGIPPKDKDKLSPDEEYMLQLYRAVPEGDKRRMFIQVTRDQVNMAGGKVPEPPASRSLTPCPPPSCTRSIYPSFARSSSPAASPL